MLLLLLLLLRIELLRYRRPDHLRAHAVREALGQSTAGARVTIVHVDFTVTIEIAFERCLERRGVTAARTTFNRPVLSRRYV